MENVPTPTGAAVRSVWGKFNHQSDHWYPLWAHLEDTAAVASELYAYRFSESQRNLLADAFGNERLARALAVWLAAAHDVGKATVAFAMKVPVLRARMEGAGLVFPRLEPSKADQRAYPHGLAGQHAVRDFLSSHASDVRSKAAVRAISQIIGGHHGTFPPHTDPPPVFGSAEDESWRSVRRQLLERANRLSGLSDQDWQVILRAKITEPVQALLNGFLIMCDWIASDVSFFPITSQIGSNESSSICGAKSAVEALRLDRSWSPIAVGDAHGYYGQVFGIDEPRPVQLQSAEMVNGLSEPSLVLIEAPTGEGKTEIAFTSAQTLAEKFGLSGVLLVLPTRATSNAMFSRTLNWLEAVIPPRSSVSATLAHGKAEFDEQFEGLVSASYQAQIYDEDASPDPVVANQWFRGRKKNVFADFVIGTVDQLLFTALKSKHSTLRHLGFSSKVVVIDEVHAADTFMQTFLHVALEWLGAYGVPVVALSATLPPAQRAALLASYQRGALFAKGVLQPRTPARRAKDPRWALPQRLAKSMEYPLITTIGAREFGQSTARPSGRETKYVISSVSEEQRVDQVLELAGRGGCIAVIANTVDRAQDTFRQLAERFDGEIRLLHSRFSTESRSETEKELVERLGPSSENRPEQIIVVATQVIEASLDLDFDMMFSDFAPTDLLLQRLGRVHRHARSQSERPQHTRQAQMVITGGADIIEGSNTPTFLSGSERVYGRSLLLRSAAALQELFAGEDRKLITIPADVPDLIRTTYSEAPPIPDAWREAFEQGEQERVELEASQRKRSQNFAIKNPGSGRIEDWSSLAYNEASEELGQAQVRDAELSVEVVLVQMRAGRLYPVPWLPEPHRDTAIDSLFGVADDTAREVAKCTVSLPSWMTRDGRDLDFILDDLESSGYEGWQRSYWLKGLLPLVLDEKMRARVGPYELRYDREVGLLVEGRTRA